MFVRLLPEVLVRLLGQPGAWLEDKHTFSCLLPGHRESTPSARWVWQRHGSVLYQDMHVRSEQRMYWVGSEWHSVSLQVFAVIKA